MAASLQLEPLEKAAEAVRLLREYFHAYPAGQQVQAAHRLLCRAYLAQRELEAARETARAYLARYPRGWFREPMQELAGTR